MALDKEILKKASSNYQTGEPLSDDVITTLLNLKNLSTGNDLQRQIVFGLLSLTLLMKVTIKTLMQSLKRFMKLLVLMMSFHQLFIPMLHLDT